MKTIGLKQIYFENYKLFTKQSLVFSDRLNIFDGPNGYGKTSVFDAIEFLITGTIKRVTDSTAINGTLSYNNIFLANDSQKDMIIKAEFQLTEDKGVSKSIVVAKRIPGIRTSSSSVERNPKKLTEITNTYLLPSFDTEELREAYLIPQSQLPQKQIEWFGETSQNMYTMIYYVQQEDRLDFFKKSEKDRISSIDVLFQISEEKQKLVTITQAQKKLKAIIKGLDTQIKSVSKDLTEKLDFSEQQAPEYFRLFKQELYWDEQVLQFKNEGEFNETIQAVQRIKAFINDLSVYEVDIHNRMCIEFLTRPEEEQRDRLLAYLLYTAVGENVKVYLEKQKTLQYLQKQQQLAERQQYTDLEYQRLAKILGLEVNIEYIQALIISYQQQQSNIKTTQQTLQAVLQIRQQLLTKSAELYGENVSGVCQYCGYDWKNVESLTEQISLTTQNLKNLADASTQQCIEIISQLKTVFEEQYKKAIENEQQSYLSDGLFREFNRLHNAKYLQMSVDAQHLLALLKIRTADTFSTDASANATMLADLQSKIKESIQILPPEYEDNKKRLGYDVIYDSYFGSIEKAKELTVEKVDKKINYIRYTFHATQQALYKKKQELSGKLAVLKKEIEPLLAEYAAKWKQSISKYQAQIISKIEIPFYIYSARILQSYQGGQGILTTQSTSATVGEVDSIRFTPPGHEHDILYTMSSGQLSGVLLSFSLALNKVFRGDGLNTIFIDDPVQCMDDLNIVSFVELLRSEFAQSQLLISTHEKSFANYISYKYKKQNLAYQHINLKEL